MHDAPSSTIRTRKSHRRSDHVLNKSCIRSLASPAGLVIAPMQSDAGSAGSRSPMASGMTYPSKAPTGVHTSDGNTSTSQNSHMESSVTRLLVATKLLLESLTQWSQGRESETNVSRIYVRLGNDFNAALSAFISANVDMTYVSLSLTAAICIPCLRIYGCVSKHACPSLHRLMPWSVIFQESVKLLSGCCKA